MSGAYIEMLPPDRPIHMIGQPIIKLVADGGPGGDLGDLAQWRRRPSRRFPYPPAAAPYYQPYYDPYAAPPYYFLPMLPASARPVDPSDDYVVDGPSADGLGQDRRRAPRARGSRKGVLGRAWDGIKSAFGAPSLGQAPPVNQALQAELQRVAGGEAPDVSAEYFKPTEIPGLPSEYEGPHTGREGVFPKKLRDMVVYDMGGSAYLSPADLGCCGADSMAGFGRNTNFQMSGFGRNTTFQMGEPWAGGPEKGAWNSGGMAGGFGRNTTFQMGQEGVRVTDFVRQGGVDAGAAISGMGQFVKVTDFVRGSGVDAGAALGEGVRVTDFIRGSGVDAGGALGQEGVRVTDFVRQRGVDEGAALSGNGQFVSPRQVREEPGSRLGQLAPEAEAKLLKGYCDGLEQKAKDIAAAVAKANADSSLSAEQKRKVAISARQSLSALKGDWGRCRSRLKAILKYFKAQGDLKEFGLGDVGAKVDEEDKLAACRAKLLAIRAAACKGRKKQ